MVMMAVWEPEGVHEEYELSVSNGKIQEIRFFPFKMFHLDVLNKGEDDIKVMVNSQSLFQACTLSKGERRDFEAKSPKYSRIAFYSEGTATVKVTATR
jgi:hypothetical protein